MKNQTKNSISTQLSTLLLSTARYLAYPLIASTIIALSLSSTPTNAAYDHNYQEPARATMTPQQTATAQLLQAVWANDITLARKAIREEANIHGINKFSEPPLLLATEQGHIDIMQLLLAHHADPNTQNKYGETGLHKASCRYNHTAATLLLLKNNADIHMRNSHNNKTALISAINGLNYTNVELLILCGAYLDTTNDEDKAAFTHASLVMRKTIEDSATKRIVLEEESREQNQAIIEMFMIPELASIISSYAEPYCITEQSLVRAAPGLKTKKHRTTCILQ